MRKFPLFVGAILFFSVSIAQDIRHEAVAVNIEVPVRVFKGDVFVDNLTINDFELYEDGVIQNIDAVYLIKKTEIERRDVKDAEKGGRFIPETIRHFVLIFELRNYRPLVEQAVSYFVDEVIMPDDGLIVVTPIKTYNIKEDAWKHLDREAISRQLIHILRRDVMTGYLGERYLEGERLFDFARQLKNIPGHKTIFFFFEQELEQINFTSFNDFFGALEYLSRLSEIYTRNTFNHKKIKVAFSDSSILFHLIYIKDNMYYGVDMERIVPISGMTGRVDVSVGFFDTFRRVARATGGITDVSANASSSLKKAVNATENYYLLYYTPKNYPADGKFKNIKVKVKGKSYRITHREGYISN